MHWLIAPLLALIALGTRTARAQVSDLPGWTKVDAVGSNAPDRGWGAAATTLRRQLVSSRQVAVTDGYLMVRREWSPDGSVEMHVLYKKL